jgi:hypothetical protein
VVHVRRPFAVPAWATGCFLASGAAGLLYELVWSKQLAYLLGSSLRSAAIVVAAPGRWRWAGWLGSRHRSGSPAAATRRPVATPARPRGLIYFAKQDHVIRRLGTDGTIDTVAGTGERGYSGDGGQARVAQLDTPYDIAFAPNGDMYLADTGNNVIRRIDTNGVISTVAGDGEPIFAGDGGLAATCPCAAPRLSSTPRAPLIADT